MNEQDGPFGQPFGPGGAHVVLINLFQKDRPIETDASAQSHDDCNQDGQENKFECIDARIKA